MIQQDFECTIVAPIPPSTAFGLISRVGDWWAVNFKGRAKELNEQFTVHFARTTWSLMEVVEIEADRRIIWKVVDCYLPIFQDPYLWKDNLITWDIEAYGPQTKVTMTHVGLVPGVKFY